MRNYLCFLFLAIGLLASAEVPTAADLTEYYSAGQVCVCVQFAQPVCNDIVWCGTYNGWNTDVKNLTKFQAVKNFEGWYVVSFTDNNSDVRGKAVQLRSDGSFNWKYQTGNDQSWTIVSGSATIHASGGESELRNISKSTPLIVISSKWKNNICSSGNAYSGTLPILYINTENKTPITSKETYVNATYYLDNLGLKGYTSIASKEQPDSLQIKGRGNYTWKDFDKKPYRLKLNNKQALMGLEKSKHWTLLAHADDYFCWLKNTVGFLLSEQIGLEWTPKQAPIEVVLNGDYIGLYMLTEQIRVDKKRVNIAEQEDEETDPLKVTGGWLIEIDNYQEPYHVTVYEPANKWHGVQEIWFTPKTPEILSQQQTNYLQAQMDSINTALYEETEANLVNILDMQEAAKYYLVCELMSDCESYHGSCYLYKNENVNANVNANANENQKWYFGPVWDFGNSFNDRDKFIYDQPQFSQNWIGQLAEKKAFDVQRDSLWKHWKYYDYVQIEALVDSFGNLIKEAAKSDAARWPQYNHADVKNNHAQFMEMFDRHVNWLTSQWGEATQVEGLRNEETELRKVMIDGCLYIIRDKEVYNILGCHRRF